MPLIDRQTLAAWAADALDPSRRREVDLALQGAPELRWEAEQIEAELQETRPAPSRWRVPPPGLGLPVTATPVAVLDQQATRVRVDLPAEGRLVVVLRREEGEWQVQTVLRPTTTLDLAAGGSWAIALAEPTWDHEVDAVRGYEGLRDGINKGRVPVTSLTT